MQRAVPSVPRERKEPVTPGSIRTAACAVIAVLTLALAPGAFAANEVGDAGDLRVTANDMGDSAVTEINGTLHRRDGRRPLPDLPDGRRVLLGQHRRRHVREPRHAALPLRRPGVRRLRERRRCAGIARFARCPRNHRFSPATGGEYFLAVSQYNRDPQSSQGEIFQDNFSRMQFPDGVMFANGFGAAETLSGWNGRAPGGRGTYRITLTGTRTCVPPDTTPPTVDLRSPVDGSHVAQGAEVVGRLLLRGRGRLGPRLLRGLDGRRRDARHEQARPGHGHRHGARQGRQPDGGDEHGDRGGPRRSRRSRSPRRPTARSTSAVEHVAADYACADEPNGSGLDTCVGDVPNGADVDTDHARRAQLHGDRDRPRRQHASAVAHYTVVDVTAPQIALTTPSQGAVYDLGQQVAASYSCADEDGGSGLAACTGTVANGAARRHLERGSRRASR